MLAVAHRAGNDLDALHAATEAGAHVLEADVHRHRGRLEVRHSKAVGRLPLLYDAGQLTRRGPDQLLLHEVLDAVRSGSRLMLDLKGPGAVGLHVAEAVHRRVPDAPVLVCSRWWPGLAPFAALPDVRQVLTARTPLELRRLQRRLARGRRPYGVSLHRSLLTRAVVADLRATVELVLTWGVDDLPALAEVVGLGVNGVISDEAEVLRAVLARR